MLLCVSLQGQSVSLQWQRNLSTVCEQITEGIDSAIKSMTDPISGSPSKESVVSGGVSVVSVFEGVLVIFEKVLRLGKIQNQENN